jgi:dTDP-4-dehydrorhamnose reductase
VVRVASLYRGTDALGKGYELRPHDTRTSSTVKPLRVANRIRVSPTYAREVVVALVALFERSSTGVFHVVNEGSCTWYEFAEDP